jgi:hypothetical protein
MKEGRKGYMQEGRKKGRKGYMKEEGKEGLCEGRREERTI